jgi:two-component system LytT family sensor kinase
MYNHPRLRYYILFFVFFSIFWFLFKLGGNPHAVTALQSTAFEMLLNIGALVVTVEWLLPRFFYRAAYFRWWLGLALIIAAGGTSNILFQLHLMGIGLRDYQVRMAKPNEHFFYWFWSDLVAGSYFMIAGMALGGFAIRLAFDRILTARRMAVLESERLFSELESLKNQINPHFIFNALNTIYYKIDRTNEPARVLTQQFSSLLRYQLYECNEPLVKIENEIRFIGNYIELQKERTDCFIRVSCSGFETAAGFGIPPHVLAPLVENCFKHVSHIGDKENYIELACSREGDIFRFCAVNSIDPLKKNDRGGIGLVNTRKRLELLCRDRFTLLATERDGCFETSLTLSIA